MIFSQFITKTDKYLKTVRVLKNYVSFDMIFPSGWVMLKKSPENVEILQTETKDGIVTSFVCQNDSEIIQTLESTMDLVIKTNIEREEKEKLFKLKVKELQNIFEKEKLSDLKELKIAIEVDEPNLEEYSKLVENGTETKSEGVEQGA
jgi:hypothetical protein